MTDSNPSTPMGRVLGALSQPSALGPLIFGLALGGVPFGILVCHFGVAESWGRRFFEYLTPAAALLAALGAIATVNNNAGRLLLRAFLTALSACIPVPLITWAVLAWRGGYEILDSRNLPFVALLSGMWALLVTFLGWLLAVAFVFLRNARPGTPKIPLYKP